jgi:hypothetical protein
MFAEGNSQAKGWRRGGKARRTRTTPPARTANAEPSPCAILKDMPRDRADEPQHAAVPKAAAPKEGSQSGSEAPVGQTA